MLLGLVQEPRVGRRLAEQFNLAQHVSSTDLQEKFRALTEAELIKTLKGTSVETEVLHVISTSMKGPEKAQNDHVRAFGALPGVVDLKHVVLGAMEVLCSGEHTIRCHAHFLV